MKKIEEMNIEELRAALKESEAARADKENALESARKEAETYKTLWDMNEKENNSLKAKIEAIKAVASLC